MVNCKQIYIANMIEARRIKSICRCKAFAGYMGQRKGSSPKEAEAQGYPGQTGNTCLTVAQAECYHLTVRLCYACAVFDGRCFVCIGFLFAAL